MRTVTASIVFLALSVHSTASFSNDKDSLSLTSTELREPQTLLADGSFPPIPPTSLTGKPLRDWLRDNWFHGHHNRLGYDDARRKMYSIIDAREDGLVHGVYSGFSQPKASVTFLDPINAEHTVPQSWFRKKEPMKSDIHHLFPTHKDVNSARGSDPFADIEDSATKHWYGITSNGAFRKLSQIPSSNLASYSEDTNSSFEPPEGQKGDTARAIFYFYTMYPGRAQTIDAIAQGGAKLLYKWHRNDPPDDREKKRNQLIEQQQGNRNPYIDYPNLVCVAWDIVC